LALRSWRFDLGASILTLRSWRSDLGQSPMKKHSATWASARPIAGRRSPTVRFRRAKMNEGSGNAARLAIKYPFCGGTILA
jgi:hypothetical protein